MNHDARKGRLDVQGEQASIHFERRLPFRPEVVWKAITDPAERAQWLGPSKIEGRVGGVVETLAGGPPVPDSMRQVSGKIRVWDPPRVFEHEWNQTLIGATVARYELLPDGEGTILKFTHSGFSVQNAKGFIPGEHAYLDRLEAQLGKAEAPSWSARYSEVQALYGPMPKFDGPPPARR